MTENFQFSLAKPLTLDDLVKALDNLREAIRGYTAELQKPITLEARNDYLGKLMTKKHQLDDHWTLYIAKLIAQDQ